MVRNWVGIRQGKLLVARQVDSRSDGQAMWECRCNCGTTCIKSSGALRQGVKSCSPSCGVTESNRNRAVTGVAHGKEWAAWTAAKQRCYNPKNPQYAHYGGRGITMCDEWKSSFPAFYAHIGPAPTKDRRSSLDRINNNGNYEPNNVRWATPTAQLSNRRSSIVVHIDGLALSAADACSAYNLPYTTIYARWRRGIRGAALVAPRANKPKEVT